MEAWHAEAAASARPGDRAAVLVLSGAEDVVIPPENDEVLAGIWPTCEVERYDGGHAFSRCRVHQVAERIVSFCHG